MTWCIVLKATGVYGVCYLRVQLDSLGSLQVSEWVFLWEKSVALIRGLQTIGSLEYSWGWMVWYSPRVWEVTNKVFCLLREESYCDYLNTRSQVKKKSTSNNHVLFLFEWLCVDVHTFSGQLGWQLWLFGNYGNEIVLLLSLSTLDIIFISHRKHEQHGSFQSTTRAINSTVAFTGED